MNAIDRHRAALESGKVTRSNVIGLRKLFNAAERADRGRSGSGKATWLQIADAIWVPTTFSTAQAYELRTQKGRLLLRRTSLAEARRIAAMLDSTRSTRSREAVLGARWADAAPHVTRRKSKVIARSNRQAGKE